uniref:Folliculin-interacting protein 1-like isoform X2 n=1 Tax=Petromyzon marinus TaxID=7757 RepID=A0AAJ7SUN8_PETMA|nr:folliculin-interacting protein 1-like isoform X2 [Petromyzon marinus]
MPSGLLEKLLRRGCAPGPDEAGAAGAEPGQPCPGWCTGDDDLRLVVFRDCERRGRQLLFDSKTVRKLPRTSPECGVKQARVFGRFCYLGSASSTQQPDAGLHEEEGPRYQALRQCTDVKMLCEMMFGSVAVSLKTSTLKIHHIRCPPQLLLSRVYRVRTCSGTDTGTSTLNETFNCSNPLFSEAKPCTDQTPECGSQRVSSTPMEMPLKTVDGALHGGRMQPGSLGSMFSMPGASLGSLSSLGMSPGTGTWHRSLHASGTTSQLSRRVEEDDFRLVSDAGQPSPSSLRRMRLALGVVVALPVGHEAALQHFLFTHFLLLEGRMRRLKAAVEKAMIACRGIEDCERRLQAYVGMLVEALAVFRRGVRDLYSQPRLQQPVWLTLSQEWSNRQAVCHRFMSELSALASVSGRQRFIQALLTAVLTHHVGWVATLTPGGHPLARTAQALSWSAATVPPHNLNPLQAQLCSLQGCVGDTPWLTRTVVLGRDRAAVARVLHVLTHFIRCPPLQERETEGPQGPERARGPAEHPDAVEMPEAEGAGYRIFTSLVSGEVEMSDYVVVSVVKRGKQQEQSDVTQPSELPTPTRSGIQLRGTAGDKPAHASTTGGLLSYLATSAFSLRCKVNAKGGGADRAGEGRIGSETPVPRAAKPEVQLLPMKESVAALGRAAVARQSRVPGMSKIKRLSPVGELSPERKGVIGGADVSFREEVLTSDCHTIGPCEAAHGPEPQSSSESDANDHGLVSSFKRQEDSADQGEDLGGQLAAQDDSQTPGPATDTRSRVPDTLTHHLARQPCHADTGVDVAARTGGGGHGSVTERAGDSSAETKSSPLHRAIPVSHCEIPLPRCEMRQVWHRAGPGLAPSLLGGCCSRFVPEFVLQGLSCSRDAAVEQIRRGLQQALSPLFPPQDEAPTAGPPSVAGQEGRPLPSPTSLPRVQKERRLVESDDVRPSGLVREILHSTLQLWKMRLSADFGRLERRGTAGSRGDGPPQASVRHVTPGQRCCTATCSLALQRPRRHPPSAVRINIKPLPVSLEQHRLEQRFHLTSKLMPRNLHRAKTRCLTRCIFVVRRRFATSQMS